MPTRTETMTIPTAAKVTKLPVSTKKSVPSKSSVATLRSLYPRAARAFLHHNVTLTHSLLLSAFSILEPPCSASLDPLSSHRRKWDILRITLETTLSLSTSGQRSEELPESLRSVLTLSPPPLIAMMHTRSLRLFTPAHCRKPSSEFLPSQILISLVLASIKLECAQVGREMVDDWLSLRNQSGYDAGTEGKQAEDEAEGYGKVLEMYCLYVLPRLEDWDYAREFLRYENELPHDRKSYLVQSLQVLHAQHLENIDAIRERQQQSASSSLSSSRTPTPRPSPARAPSPSPSSSSTSSNSTHTAVPLTPRPHRTSSLASLTPTSRTLTPTQSLAPRTPAAAPRHSRASTPLPVPPPAPPIPAPAVVRPSLLAVLKTSLVPQLTAANVTFAVLMFLVPLVSFVLRLRRRRLRVGGPGGAAVVAVRPHGHAADETRKRLRAGWWAAVRKAVGDTVMMAGSGLV